MTREEALDRLVELDVAKWGEGERAASRRMHGQYSHGRLVNRLAYYDLDHIDEDLAEEAKRLFTADDLRALEEGG